MWAAPLVSMGHKLEQAVLDAGKVAEGLFVGRQDGGLPAPECRQSPVHVIARLKPPSPLPLLGGRRRSWEQEEALLNAAGLSCDQTGIRVAAPSSSPTPPALRYVRAPLRFVLDGVLHSTQTQEDAYAAVAARATEALLAGSSSAIVAVGAPGSGKTYTLFGPEPALSGSAGSEAWTSWGLLPRMAHHIFSLAADAGGIQNLLGFGGSISCTFVEIRNEEVYPPPTPYPTPPPTPPPLPPAHYPPTPTPPPLGVRSARGRSQRGAQPGSA